MRKAATATLGVAALGALLALGFAVAALGSSSSGNGPASTSETTTTETKTTTTPTTTTTPASTSEQPTAARYRSALGPLAEVPRPTGASAGSGGTFSLTLTHGSTYSVTWRLTFHGLTGKAVAAHIHRGKPGKAGPVLLALCGPCRSGRSGKAQVSQATVDALAAGSAYVNVHTAKNAAGEIRGQLRKAG